MIEVMKLHTRLDIDQRIRNVVVEWKKRKGKLI